jgi:predicted nucleic acid-binding protein
VPAEALADLPDFTHVRRKKRAGWTAERQAWRGNESALPRIVSRSSDCCAALPAGYPQAIARDGRLITRNGKDFRRIEGLTLEDW